MEAAFFDLDKTVIDRASIAAFGRPFMKGGLINRRLVARAAVSQLIYLYFGADEDRLVRVRESMLAITKGWDRAQVRQIVRETMLQTIEPIMYAEALELMELHRAAGHRVYLVSASPEEIVLPLADLLGVDGAICSRGEVDEQGRYTGRMAFYAYGEAKAFAMRELAERTGLDLSASSAYSDSATDLPMLEAVGRPVAVNPDRALAKVARERGWEMRNFTKPIRLRDRVGRTTPVVTTSLAVAGAALLLWRRGVKGRHLAGPTGRARRVAQRSASLLMKSPGERPDARLRLAQTTSGDDADGNQDGQDKQLLHGADPRRVPQAWLTQRLGAGGSDGEEVPGAGVRGRVAKLGHRPRLDLTDALPGQVEVLADLLERPGLTSVQPEAQAQDLALTLVER